MKSEAMIEENRTWRTSTYIPNLICDITWAPFRLSNWLVRTLWRFFRFILAAWFVAVGLTALANISSSSGPDLQMFCVILVVVLFGGAVLMSDWLTVKS